MVYNFLNKGGSIMRLFYTLFVFFFLSVFSFAETVSFEWTPNSEPDLKGYRLFSRIASHGYDYSNPAWEGTDTTCDLDGIDNDKDYRFVVRAFDTEGYESGNSNEVSFIQGTIPDGKPPESPKTFSISITVEVQ